MTQNSELLAERLRCPLKGDLENPRNADLRNEAAAELDRRAARIEKLEAALRPFASANAEIRAIGLMTVTLSEAYFMRAKTALSGDAP